MYARCWNYITLPSFVEFCFLEYCFCRWLRKRSVSMTDLEEANLTNITNAGEYVRRKRVKRFAAHCAELDPLLMEISVKGDEYKDSISVFRKTEIRNISV